MRKNERDELMLRIDGIVPSTRSSMEFSQGFRLGCEQAKKLVDEVFRKPQLCMGDSAALAMAVSFLEKHGFEVVDQRYRGFILALDGEGGWVFVHPRLFGPDETVDYYADRGLFEDAVCDWNVEGDARIRCDVLAIKQLTPTSMLVQHHIDALN